MGLHLTGSFKDDCRPWKIGFHAGWAETHEFCTFRPHPLQVLLREISTSDLIRQQHLSRAHPGCPWENGCQESFYGKFKLKIGDPNRFRSLGELVAETYRAIWVYNITWIRSMLKMPPRTFANQTAAHTKDP